jgi:hypothetical protein
MVEGDKKARLKKVIPRILKAAISSILLYFIVYYVSSRLSPYEAFFPSYRPLTGSLTAIFVILLFAVELSYGTVFHYIFSFARSLVFLIYLVVDVRIFLTIVIFVLVLGLAKTVLQTINFLTGKATKDQRIESLSSIEKLKS